MTSTELQAILDSLIAKDKQMDEIQKEIERRNALFQGKTPAEQRVLVARDVLMLMDQEKISAKGGVYVQNDNLRYEASRNPDQGMRELLFTCGETCEVCAKGALMVSMTLFNNQEKGSDYQHNFTDLGVALDFQDGRIKNGLTDVFDTEQLDLMEEYFELTDEYSLLGLLRPTRRLELIMLNVIENHGTFDPNTLEKAYEEDG